MKNSVIKFECSLPKWGDSSVEVKNLRQSGAGLMPSGIPAVECKAHGDRMIGTVWGLSLIHISVEVSADTVSTCKATLW